MQVAATGWLAVLLLGSMAVGCGVDDGYCCAVEKVSAGYEGGDLAQLSSIAEAENEDVCQTVVEANYPRFEDALAACAAGD